MSVTVEEPERTAEPNNDDALLALHKRIEELEAELEKASATIVPRCLTCIARGWG